jgi:uncharacterized membrane protein YdjX (TVP38/TMEM64 family)
MSALTQWLTSSEEFFQRLGWLGVLAYAAGVVVLQLVCAPLSPVGVAAGLMFGLGRGFTTMAIGTAVGAAINFLLSRTVLRGPVARRLATNDKFRLIDAAIGREGWKIVALLRFCPIPFGLANYAYGLTAIPFWPYLWATVLAVIPGNLFFVWLGVTAHAGLSAGGRDAPGEASG